MWAQKFKEFIAIASIGDGVWSLIVPRRHALLWVFGPEKLRKIALWLAENPRYMRLRGIARIGFGVWLALRQYEETPRPWYQRW